ncbi:MAG TPA: pilus assembly PilX N-terminal domain-containing protein [Kofleriaceae bacterium]|nr:pilus assembly PilX N-terminal domain-containing protein [Kofleriaceae bacterium]
MTSSRPRRDPERGNSLLLALIVMSSLATLGSLTVVSVQSSLKASTNDRAGSIATYAAESGGAMAIEFLRTNYVEGTRFWSDFTHTKNLTVEVPAFPANGAQPGNPANPFTADQNAWFNVEILNNRDDPKFDAPVGSDTDGDGQLIIRSTGHGPQGSVAIIEWEIRRFDNPAVALPPPLAGNPNTTIPVMLLGWHIVL